MKNKLEIVKTIVIIIFIALAGYYFSNQWFTNRIVQEQNTTILRIQNEIHRVVKQEGSININLYDIDNEGEIQIIDTIILVEDE